MINFLTKLIVALDKMRLSLIYLRRRKTCKCLCDMCTVESCPSKQKVHNLDCE